MSIWQFIRNSKEIWSWYSFLRSVAILFTGIAAAVIALLSTTWSWYWQTLRWAGVAFAFLAAWLIIAIGIFLIGAGVRWWRGKPPENRRKTSPAPSTPPTLGDGLYVSDIRLTFQTLSDHHTEITMRVFNGTGRVVEFFGLSGHIKFNTPNGADPLCIGSLPTPSVRSDMARQVDPFKEWLLILEQRVPASEADKLLATRSRDIPIHFDLHALTIEVRARDDQSSPIRLPIWGGVSYSHGNGFGQIIYLNMNEKIGASDTVQ